MERVTTFKRSDEELDWAIEEIRKIEKRWEQSEKAKEVIQSQKLKR